VTDERQSLSQTAPRTITLRFRLAANERDRSIKTTDCLNERPLSLAKTKEGKKEDKHFNHLREQTRQGDGEKEREKREREKETNAQTRKNTDGTLRVKRERKKKKKRNSLAVLDRF